MAGIVRFALPTDAKKREEIVLSLAAGHPKNWSILNAEWHELAIGDDDDVQIKRLSEVLGPPLTEGDIDTNAYSGPFDESAFLTFDQISKAMIALTDTHKNFTSLDSLDKTENNNDIYSWRIGNGKRRILLTGSHHAREWISAQVPFLIGQRLIENAATNKEIETLLQDVEFSIIPVLNPDGKNHSHTIYREWRKNRRVVGQDSYGREVFGTDLNRNYDIDFNGGGDSSDLPQLDNYNGGKAFSEKETQAIASLSAKYRFDAAINYHCYGQAVLYPFAFSNAPCNAACIARLAKLAAAARNVANAMGKWGGEGYDVLGAKDFYSHVSGDASDWLFGTQNTAALTIELPPRGYSDGDSIFRMGSDQIDIVFEGAWLGVLEFAKLVVNGSL